MVCEGSVRHLIMTMVVQTYWTGRHGNKWWMPVEVMGLEETMAQGTTTREMMAQEMR